MYSVNVVEPFRMVISVSLYHVVGINPWKMTELYMDLQKLA
jgi:hypothetical protein